MSCCSNSSCQTSVKLLATFASSASRMHKTTELLLHKTTDFTPDMWPPNRPDLSFVDYRLLTVIQECIYQKRQNIVDELWLLTELHYISQGSLETPISLNRWAIMLKFCWKFTSIYVYQKLTKIKGCNFFASQCRWQLFSGRVPSEYFDKYEAFLINSGGTNVIYVQFVAFIELLDDFVQIKSVQFPGASFCYGWSYIVHVHMLVTLYSTWLFYVQQSYCVALVTYADFALCSTCIVLSRLGDDSAGLVSNSDNNLSFL